MLQLHLDLLDNLTPKGNPPPNPAMSSNVLSAPSGTILAHCFPRHTQCTLDSKRYTHDSMKPIQFSILAFPSLLYHSIKWFGSSSVQSHVFQIQRHPLLCFQVAQVIHPLARLPHTERVFIAKAPICLASITQHINHVISPGNQCISLGSSITTMATFLRSSTPVCHCAFWYHQVVVVCRVLSPYVIVGQLNISPISQTYMSWEIIIEF